MPTEQINDRLMCSKLEFLLFHTILAFMGRFIFVAELSMNKVL